jgi:hypothetical protein
MLKRLTGSVFNVYYSWGKTGFDLTKITYAENFIDNFIPQSCMFVHLGAQFTELAVLPKYSYHCKLQKTPTELPV